MIEAAVDLLEGAVQEQRIVISKGAGRQWDRDLVALAAISHEGRACFGQRCIAGTAA